MQLCLLFLAAILSAKHWNQFRGPHGDGQATSESLPMKWSESKNIAWKTGVAGRAWSSPVVWGDQIWMTTATADGKKLYAVCVDTASGEIRHNVTVFDIAKPMFCYPYNSYASSTPVVEQGRLWVHYGSAGTACLDTADGRVLWTRQDLPCNHYRGPGSSPIVFRDLMIVHFDGYDFQYVVALDKHTGKTVWKKDRNIDYRTDNGDYKKAFATPTVIEHEGELQLISPSAEATIAYNPLTGEELWKVYHGGFNAAARPLYRHGRVFLNLEGGKRLLAVRPGKGDVTDTHIDWTYRKATPTRTSQLVIRDHFYMISDTGVITCLDIKTGQATWTHRIGGRYSASPIHAAGRIYFFDEDNGQSHVIEANPNKFHRLAKNKLDAGCMASPAVAGDALIVRTKTHLYRIK